MPKFLAICLIPSPDNLSVLMFTFQWRSFLLLALEPFVVVLSFSFFEAKSKLATFQFALKKMLPLRVLKLRFGHLSDVLVPEKLHSSVNSSSKFLSAGTRQAMSERVT